MNLFSKTVVSLFTFLTYSWVAQAQELLPQVELADRATQLEVQSQLETGLPNLLEKMQLSITQVKAKEIDLAIEELDRIHANLRELMDVLAPYRSFQEIKYPLQKMNLLVGDSLLALEDGQTRKALRFMKEADQVAQVLSKSSVLKMSSAEISLEQASDAIRRKNYDAAGLLIDRAIDQIVIVQEDPKLNTADLQKLKSEMIITKQQVALGYNQYLKSLNDFRPGLAAARINAINTYYWDAFGIDDSYLWDVLW